jgi:TrpR-related protein YerC/YecD
MVDGLDLLVTSLVHLTTPEDCQALLQDLLTPREIATLAQRFAVASELLRGATYEQAKARTGASAATISRVRRALYHGRGGYRRVLTRAVESANP